MPNLPLHFPIKVQIFGKTQISSDMTSLNIALWGLCSGDQAYLKGCKSAKLISQAYSAPPGGRLQAQGLRERLEEGGARCVGQLC